MLILNEPLKKEKAQVYPEPFNEINLFLDKSS